MPAKSKAQQKFMGMVHAAKKGEKPASKEVAKAAKGMTKKAAKDFAGTKHKGLPEKVKKVDEVAGPEKCWPGHRKVGTKPGTGKNAGKRVNDCEKIDEALLREFEEHIAEVKITSGPNKGKDWSPNTPGPTNKNYKEIDGNIPSPPDGATAPPPGYKPPQPKKDKRASVDVDDAEMTAEAKQTYGGKGKQMTKSEHDADVKKKKEKEKMKKMAEAFMQIGRLEQMIFEAKKSKKKEDKVEEDPNEGNAFGKAVRDAKKDGIQKGEKVKVGGKEYPVKESSKEEKCNHTPKGKKCPVHGLKECGMYEGNDGNLANNAKPYDKVTRGDVIAGRLGKDEMGGKKKKDKKTTETFMPSKDTGTKYPTVGGPVGKGIQKAGELVGKGIEKVVDKVKGATGEIGTKTDESYTVNGKKVSKAAYEKEMAKAGKGKKKVKEGWTHDTLAAELFESGDEYMVTLHNKLAKQIKG